MDFNLSRKQIVLGIALLVTMIFSWIMVAGMTDRNDLHEYKVWQGLSGQVEVIDTPGYYMSNFGNYWTYPRAVQAYWTADKEGGATQDHSIRVTFNDAGTARMSTMVQFTLPVEKQKRLMLHSTFGGNIENIKHAVHAHLVNCIKNTGPLMSASENQAARKAEYTQVVEEQLRRGLYSMRRTTVALRDRMDDKGNPIKVEATEIVTDDKGVPIRAERSPLESYGIEVIQFSITGTDYDDRTIAQFAAKQEAFLAAERSKAEREQEIQKKLMIEAQGLRQVAEIDAQANMVKAKAVTEGQMRVEVAAKEKEAVETKARQEAEVSTIQAQQRIEVAKREKEAAETAAAQKLSVAEIDKKAAETKAAQEAAVARIAAENMLKVAEYEAGAAAKKSEAIIKLAEAKAQEIKLGGAVQEKDRVLAEIAARRDIGIAEAFTKVQVPQMYFGGGSGSGSQGNLNESLLSFFLLKNSGLMPEKSIPVIKSEPAK